jgi:exonuclease SbcC
LVESHKKYGEISKLITSIKQKIALHKVEMKSRWDKADRLKKHEYDPNCKFCVNNAFVKDATKAKEELVKDKDIADKMMAHLGEYEKEMENYKWVEKSYETYTRLLNERSKIKDACSSHSKNIIVSTNELERMDAAYNSLVEKINLYHRNETAVENNNKVQTIIDSYKSTLSRLELELQKKNTSLIDITSKKEVFRSKIDGLSKLLDEIRNLEVEFDHCQKYLDVVGRDGIPYQVICNTVPEIEREVNAILTQIIDFTIKFETDGKNIIPYLVYDHGKWPIELSSGFERFVASIAIRVALTNISNLPKTSFLALDEGFGTLDSDQMATMSTLFLILKNMYDFIIIISHHDSLKDMVDKQIEIKKEGSFSFIKYE